MPKLPGTGPGLEKPPDFFQRELYCPEGMMRHEIPGGTAIVLVDPEFGHVWLCIQAIVNDESHVAGSRGPGIQPIVKTGTDPECGEDGMAGDLMIPPGPGQQADNQHQQDHH